MKKYLAALVLFLASNSVFSQDLMDKNYTPPIGIPMVLAANFGELRPNHFHMGVDFKTNGRIGYNLYSIADGYVSRIKVSPYGYGKVIYIDHPNGKTSVYAHCSEFKGAIDSIVRISQYADENYEVEIFPKPHEISVKKGDIIALSGNTGSSTAPHLHFEIRETLSEDALNPLVYGFDLDDHQKPDIRNMKIVAISKDGYQIPGKSIVVPVYGSNGKYTIRNNTIDIPADFCSPKGGIGLAFDIIDKLDGAPNQCGLYGTDLIVDGDTIFGQQTDRISFEHTRYVNSHRDMNSPGKYHKSYRTLHNPLAIYKRDGLGVIVLKPGETKSIALNVYDPKGNESQLNFAINVQQGSLNADFAPSPSNYLYPQDSLQKKYDNWSIQAEAFSIYEPVKQSHSSTAHFCDASIDLQKPVVIRMKLENPTLPVKNYYIAVFDGRKYRALTTVYEDGWLCAESKYAGTYSVKTDVQAPSVRGVSYNSSYIVTGNTIKLTIKEDETSLADYDLFIDGKWHLMEYESKGDFLIYERPEGLMGEHAIKIIASDVCGNEVIYERTLNFK